MRPAPNSSSVPGVPRSSAELAMMARTSAAVSVGALALMSAATAATKGAAIDVPVEDV